MRSRLFLLVAALTLGLSPRLWAQAPPTSGYEDYQKAYEAQRNEQIGRASGGINVTLTEKREALNSDAFAESLRYLRQALAKGIVLPKGDLTQTARLRQMLRILLVESYVLFADGRTRTALDTLRDGYALADVARTQPTGTLGSGLVGLALDNSLAFAYQRYLPQLTQRDCINLETLLKTRLTTPESFDDPLDRQRAEIGAVTDKWIDAAFAQTGTSTKNSDLPPDLNVSASDLSALLKWKDSPVARAALHGEAARQLDAVYNHARDLLRQPANAEFTEAPPAETGNAQVVRVARTFVAATKPAELYWECEEYVLDRAYLRLFYVTAVLRSYWWEHGHYPDSLADLHLGPEANDPFTGKPFLYHLGPDVVDPATGKPFAGERPDRVSFTETDPETGKDRRIAQPPDRDQCTLLSAGPFLRGASPTKKRQALSLTGLVYSPFLAN